MEMRIVLFRLSFNKKDSYNEAMKEGSDFDE